MYLVRLLVPILPIKNGQKLGEYIIMKHSVVIQNAPNHFNCYEHNLNFN